MTFCFYFLAFYSIVLFYFTQIVSSLLCFLTGVADWCQMEFRELKIEASLIGNEAQVAPKSRGRRDVIRETRFAREVILIWFEKTHVQAPWHAHATTCCYNNVITCCCSITYWFISCITCCSLMLYVPLALSLDAIPCCDM